MRELAITISTNQIQSWGVVGCAILIVGGLLVWKLVRSMMGRIISTVVVLCLLALMWTQRVSIEKSVKACDPQILGMHLQISDAHTRADCAASITEITTGGVGTSTG